MSTPGTLRPGAANAPRVVTRKMPDPRSNIVTGSTTILNTGTRRGGLDRVPAGADVQRPMVPDVRANPYPRAAGGLQTQAFLGSRRYNTVTSDGVSRKRKDLAMGGNTEAELQAMDRWVGTRAGLPRMGGLPAPDMSREVRGESGYPMYASFASKPNAFPRGPLPNSRTPGTGGIAWAGFGAKRRELDTQQPGPSPGGFRGTGSDSFFITPGEQASGGQQLRNVFLSYPWSTAEANINQEGDIEYKANAVIPKHFHVSAKYREFSAENQEAQIVLMQRTPAPAMPHETDYSAPVVPAHQGLVNALNLPTWNYMQACNERAPNVQGRSLTALEVLANWALMGVVRNDPSSMRSVNERGAAYSNKPGQWQRLLNTVLAGPVFVHNYWGNHVKYGQTVYLILKKVDLHDVRSDSRSDTGSYNISLSDPHSSTAITIESGRSTRPFQLVPFIPPPSRAFSRPTLADRAYHDEWGQRKYGVAFALGKVIQVDDFDTPDNLIDYAPYSVAVTAGLPKIQILMQIRRLV